MNASEPKAERSVLARLAAHGEAPSGRVVLREDPSTPDPGGSPQPREIRAEGRYQVLGEIARGGVGIVLKGHDVDLGRDVAMKVLRDEHAKDPEVVQRFVEEAQIGGQLQHPGIVPVYEMGLREDRHPYFTMKLIKGRTLALMLAEREEPSHDRRRLLSIFESVCQTVAYAHARGVIHRDLKPANVMVGAFGEVLVVDWGMGKVLTTGGVADERRAKRAAEPDLSVIATVRSEGTGSHSVVGSVMGTPRYMPPEQARGAIEQLDERADVFALGAILCEVLTGKPPYTGSEHDALGQAVRGQVEDAFRRLDAANVDADLNALAKACLSPAPAARPRDAGVVAKEIGAHLASVEERAAAARTEAAEERVKAQEEGKRRRLSLALSGAVLGLVILGGGGWFFLEQARRTRAEAVSSAVAQAVEEARLLRATAAAGTDPGPWRQAVSAGKRADEMARSRDADESTRGTTAALLAELEREQERSAARAREKARDDAMVARLEALRLSGPQEFSSGKDPGYADAFRDYGIDPTTGDPRELAERLRDSPIAEALVQGLWSWASEELRRGRDARSLYALRDAADPDPWRARVRSLKTLEEARDLVRTADVENQRVDALLALAQWIGLKGDPEGALAFLEEVRRRHPADPWVNGKAYFFARRCTPPRHSQALRYATAFLALRPDTAYAHGMVGVSLLETRDLEGAALAFREQLRREPGSAQALVHLGIVLDEAGDAEGSLRALREAVRLHPEYAFAHLNLGATLTGLGDHGAAVATLRESIRLEPESAHAHDQLGATLLGAGDLDGALGATREAVRLDPKGAVWRRDLGLVLRRRGDVRGALPELREAIRLDPGLARAHLGLGQALGDVGDHEGAIAAFEEAIRRNPRGLPERLELAGAFANAGLLAESLFAYRLAQRLGRSLPEWRLPLEKAVRDAERHLSLETRLDGVVRGTDVPADASERAELGWVAYGKSRFAAAATLYAKALADDPDLARTPDRVSRYQAACAAARAGAGDGADADTTDEESRARWRRQALEWLREDLVSREAEVTAGGTAARARLLETLAHWKRNRDLAGLRDEAEIARLPGDEQAACRALWRDVDALLEKANPTK